MLGDKRTQHNGEFHDSSSEHSNVSGTASNWPFSEVRERARPKHTTGSNGSLPDVSESINLTLPSVPKRPSALADLLDVEPVFAQHHFPWRRGAEALDAEHITRVADIAVPTLRRARFDCQPRTHCGRQHGVAVGLRKRIEELPARHR